MPRKRHLGIYRAAYGAPKCVYIYSISVYFEIRLIGLVPCGHILKEQCVTLGVRLHIVTFSEKNICQLLLLSFSRFTFSGAGVTYWRLSRYNNYFTI